MRTWASADVPGQVETLPANPLNLKVSPLTLAIYLLVLSPEALGIKIAQKPYIVWSLGPKALTYESLGP